MVKSPKCGYANNKEDALYCGLCYELLKKTVKTAQPEAVTTEQARTEISPVLTFALIAGILSGSLVYFYGASSTDSAKAAAALEEVRFREKTKAAESLLASYELGRGELLADLAKAEIEPKGFGLDGQYTKKLFKLEEDYTGGISALQLGCPNAADGGKDTAYAKWCKSFAAGEAAAMENFNKRYRQFIQKAAAD